MSEKNEQGVPAVKITKPGSPAAKKEQSGPSSVEGQAEPLTLLDYKGDNHHVLDHVHALRNGVNSIPTRVWDKVKGHPSVKHLLDTEKLLELGSAAEDEPAGGDAGESKAPKSKKGSKGKKSEDKAEDEPAGEDAGESSDPQ